MQKLEEIIKQEQVDCWGVCKMEQSLLIPRANRSRLREDTACIIVLLYGYYTEKFTNRNISRYAIPDDYHTVLGNKLAALAARLQAAYPEEVFMPFVDASPIDEVVAAVRAGLGERGENGLLLNAVYGSRCFIAELATTLMLPPSSCKAKGLCTSCGACRRVCPTGALREGGFERARCRSYITQKKGALTEWEQEQIRAGGLAWGCDLCVDACPSNRTAAKSRVAAFYENPVPVLTLAEIAKNCSCKAYGWRGEAVLQRNLMLLQEREK